MLCHCSHHDITLMDFSPSQWIGQSKTREKPLLTPQKHNFHFCLIKTSNSRESKALSWKMLVAKARVGKKKTKLDQKRPHQCHLLMKHCWCFQEKRRSSGVVSLLLPAHKGQWHTENGLSLTRHLYYKHYSQTSRKVPKIWVTGGWMAVLWGFYK